MLSALPLALPSKITVFALHTVSVFTHAGLNIHPCYVAIEHEKIEELRIRSGGRRLKINLQQDWCTSLILILILILILVLILIQYQYTDTDTVSVY